MITRRDLMLTAAAAAAVPAAGADIPAAVVRRHDDSVDSYLPQQVTDPRSRFRGALPDSTGLHSHGSAAALLGTLGTAFLYPGSRHHARPEILDRMRMAAAFIDRTISPDGNIDLLSTNFNSPPDTGFVVHGLAPVALLAQQMKNAEVRSFMEPLLKRFAHGMITGGVHTPNHRWVVCSALAQINEVVPDPACVRRIDQWLAEGIDIDDDGQYTERSTTVYNPVCDRALIVVAHKLNRPQLLDPVRRNLDSLLYLLHPNDEVVTEISRRQDQFAAGTMHRYWFALQYMAVRDNNGRYATLAARAAPSSATLPALLEYPDLLKTVPPAPLPDDFEKQFNDLRIARIRRGATSATLVLGGTSRFFTLRRGNAGLTAVRFASAFFGKGQFIPSEARKQDGAYLFEQELSAGYYQPLEKPRHVKAGEWGMTRLERRVTELCRLKQSAAVREEKDGFTVRIQAAGTPGVPLAIELAFGEGTFAGCDPVPGRSGAFLMRDRDGAFRNGGDVIRFGPALREHAYVEVRGAEPPVPGAQRVYLTASTPVDHTIRFECRREAGA